MMKTLMNTFKIVICAVLTIQLAGCGTIMYPERRGQKAGSIDVGVALLDGIGLLFFLIPGIIAFAVDFSNGTIYLPANRLGSVDMNSIKQVKFDPKHSSMASIAKIIKEHTGQTIALDQPDIKISKLQSKEDMVVQFSKVLPVAQNDKIALLNRR